MTKSFPERKYRELRRKRFLKKLIYLSISALFLAAALILPKAGEVNRIIHLILFATAMAFAFLAVKGARATVEEKKYRAGVEGEREFKKILSREKGIKIHNVPLRWGDVDAILISPGGIFVFEVKRYSGEVRCINDTWHRNGAALQQSPGEQVLRYAKIIDSLLRECGISASPIPAVVLIGTRKLSAKNCTVPVIEGKDIHHFIAGASEKMSRKLVKNAAKCIKSRTARWS